MLPTTANWVTQFCVMIAVTLTYGFCKICKPSGFSKIVYARCAIALSRLFISPGFCRLPALALCLSKQPTGTSAGLGQRLLSIKISHAIKICIGGCNDLVDDYNSTQKIDILS